MLSSSNRATKEPIELEREELLARDSTPRSLQGFVPFLDPPSAGAGPFSGSRSARSEHGHRGVGVEFGRVGGTLLQIPGRIQAPAAQPPRFRQASGCTARVPAAAPVAEPSLPPILPSPGPSPLSCLHSACVPGVGHACTGCLLPFRRRVGHTRSPTSRPVAKAGRELSATSQHNTAVLVSSRTASAVDGEDNSPARCVQCSHSIKSCRAQYLQDAQRLGVHLLDFDSDFDMFQQVQRPECRSLPPPTRSGSKLSTALPAEQQESECITKEPPAYRFRFFEEDGALRIPSSSWRVDEAPKPGSPAKQNPAAADISAGGKKRRKRGRGGTKPFQRGQRGQGGFADKWAHRDFRLKKRETEKGKTYRADAFSLRLDGSRTSTGWHGLNPPKLAREEIRSLFLLGKIKAHLVGFQPVPESGDAPAMFVDSEDILFAYRTSPAEWLEDVAHELLDAIAKLIGPELTSEATRDRCRRGVRGSHLPFIIGHYRQYSGRPTLTGWHKKSIPLVEGFLNTPVIKRMIYWVSKIVEMYFPGVAARFEECAQWHQEKYGMKPLFGLFFNLCINGMFPGQPRIFCAPHADSKNVVGVCALLIYQLQGKPFNHSQRCWIVLWEAGVVIELPPWVLFLYPSSLLYHFNVDVHDIQFVTTGGGWPTRANSKPIENNDELGRGSLVFFNEASMYQSSETGRGSLSAARAAGMTGATDFDSDVQRAFQKHGTMLDLRKPAKRPRRG